MKYYVEISLRSTGDYVLQSKWYDTYLEAVEFIGTLDFIDYNVVIVDIMKAEFEWSSDMYYDQIELELQDIQTTRADIEMFNEEIADNEYIYADIKNDKLIAELLSKRLRVSLQRANEYVRLHSKLLKEFREKGKSEEL